MSKAATAELETLDMTAAETVRVHADISRDAERKLRMRTMIHENETGKKITRKAYLEKLIADDVAKVKGASLREVSTRAKSK